MTSNSLISIIIPIFNRENTIETCILSILQQTYENFELLLIDDGSSDKSAEICRSLLKKDSRIKFWQQSNKGVSAARNLGISYASGKWITFIDSDDIIDSNHLSNLIRVEEKNADMGMIGYKYGENIEGKLQIKGSCTPNDIEIQSTNKIIQYIFGDFNPYQNPYYFCWIKIFSVSIIKTNNIKFNEKISLGEDQIFVIDYLLHTKKIFISNACSYILLNWGDKTSKLSSKLRYPEEYLLNITANYEALIKLYNQTNVSEVKAYASNYIVDRLYNKIIIQYTLPQNKKLLPSGYLKKFTKNNIYPLILNEKENFSDIKNKRIAMFSWLLCKFGVTINILLCHTYNILLSIYQKIK